MKYLEATARQFASCARALHLAAHSLQAVNFCGRTHTCQLSQQGAQSDAAFLGITKQIRFLPKTHFQLWITRIKVLLETVTEICR
jgi:hypothetical protein